ncbi:hypothetical protein C8J55DRAFT_515807 [Lentinula edodes]|uniref:Uncharacterized protein n=1 Tax=Lentinula lateritia TaxID=40482 RepID=A0A9W9ABA5_9AGAR|nr:hypothetical protein C8J55DRAFT_515807 [Lentinula edodes]
MGGASGVGKKSSPTQKVHVRDHVPTEHLHIHHKLLTPAPSTGTIPEFKLPRVRNGVYVTLLPL